MDTFELTKIFGALCASLLVFLLVKTGAEAIIHSGHGHGEGHENAYVIEVAEAEATDDAAAEEEQIDMAALMETADPANGEGLYRACAACHKLEEGANAVGPHLAGIVGREIAAVDGFAYSGALADMGDVWSVENLSAFIAAPSDWAPGTKMSYRGMRDAEDRADLIAYLEQNG